jgi:cell division protein FtsB
MRNDRKNPTIGIVAYFAVMFSLATYFMFASVLGDYGLFRRAQINAEADQLRSERDLLFQQVSIMRVKTRRLSDDYLDLDLLDEQARDVLGMLRPDEIVIR